MKKYILYAVTLLLVLSCSKERISSKSNLNEYEPLASYLKTKLPNKQIFEISENADVPIEGTQGTRVWLPKGVLMFKDGDDVDYPYTIELTELYCPKDMIYYQKPTISGTHILDAGGEVRVQVFKEDKSGDIQELFLKAGETFLVHMPSDTSRNDFKVFYDISKNRKTNWTSEKDDAAANVEADLYFDQVNGGHRANVGKLGWINCGHPRQGFYKILFVSDVDDLTNVGIFGYIPEYKTVFQAYQQKTTPLPDSTEATIVAIAIDDKSQLYYQVLEVVVTKSGSIPISLQKIKDGDLTMLLDSLSN